MVIIGLYNECVKKKKRNLNVLSTNNADIDLYLKHLVIDVKNTNGPAE